MAKADPKIFLNTDPFDPLYGSTKRMVVYYTLKNDLLSFGLLAGGGTPPFPSPATQYYSFFLRKISR